MPDDKSKTGAADRKRVNMNEDYERRDWAAKLGVSEEKLAQLVKQHGASVEALRKAIGK